MALRPHFEQSLVSSMQKCPFSLATNGSNDTGLQKMNPVTIRIFDEEHGIVATHFLDMCLTSGTGLATSGAIFDAIDGALQSRQIPWSQCIGQCIFEILIYCFFSACAHC